MQLWRLFVLSGCLLLGAWSCKTFVPVDPKVFAAPPRVYQPPPTNLFPAARAGIFIFEAPPSVPDVAYSVTMIFYQRLMEQQVFHQIEMVPQTFPSMANALQIAKEKRYELIIHGQIPYFLDSGTNSKSGIQVTLQIFEVKTGNSVCFFTDAMAAEPSRAMDLPFEWTYPKPAPSIYAMTHVLARRMAAVLAGTPLPTLYEKDKSDPKSESPRLKDSSPYYMNYGEPLK
jgi:hypothetical protein